ncbi:MFS transporter [Rathayibacter caricis DSM 15933]|uniref:MFS transporter n=1 Tax=Rathayibacter caricis DSM 15933 TaxID=1328867 RepID=A0A2T4UQD1_9MICO|nr:MFS transporter [Rathayibacter caricis]PTL71734.1 MFS transporter [Rathayibacter caricis DSM 15933]
MHDETERARVQRRTLIVVVVGQVLGGAGLAAGATVGALLAQDLFGGEGLAGLSTALLTLGSALAAFLVGRTAQRRGRRLGLGLGFAAGGLGAVGVVVAAATGSAALLFASLVVYGAGSATNLQARYAATDLALPSHRGRAISTALVSTTLGAVAAPAVVEPLGVVATGLGLPALAGPFLLAAAAYLSAGAALLLLLRPDPLLLARRLGATAAPVAAAPVRRGAAPVGATVMVLTQIAMVAIMTMTPVHMLAHDHALGDVGLVIGIHIGAMYLPSLVTGPLVDRVGPTAVAGASGIVLLGAGAIAALAPGDSLALLITALALLGLGWNLGLISGTALVVEGTSPADRARVQGSLDVLVALSGAGAGAASGAVVASSDFAVLSLGGGLLALLLIPVLVVARMRRNAV